MLKNTISTYGLVSRIFHWLMSIMLIIMLICGFYMTRADSSDLKWQIYALHKSTGMVLLILISLRLLWRIMSILPDLPSTVGYLERIGYKMGMKIMYLLMLLIPLTGMFMTLYAGRPISVYDLFTINAFEANKGLAKILKKTHEYGAIILACAAGIHVLIALYHHFIVKDRLLSRMISGK